MPGQAEAGDDDDEEEEVCTEGAAECEAKAEVEAGSEEARDSSKHRALAEHVPTQHGVTEQVGRVVISVLLGTSGPVP